MNEKQLDKTAGYLELLEDANSSVLGLKRDLKGTHDTLKTTELKLSTLEVESSKEVGRLRGELSAITRDRDALIAVIDQQEVALKLQNRQSEAGKCMFVCGCVCVCFKSGRNLIIFALSVHWI